MAKDTTHTAHRAGTAVNRSQVAKDIAHTAQHTEGAQRRTGGKWPRTARTQRNTPGGHTGEQEPSGQGHRAHNAPRGRTGEQEPSGQGHRTRNTTHRAGTPVNRSQVARDTAHATQHTERVHR